jgi:hypothetical protein
VSPHFTGPEFDFFWRFSEISLRSVQRCIKTSERSIGRLQKLDVAPI